MRPLTEEEVKTNEKAIQSFEEDNEVLSYNIESNELLLQKGIDLEAKAKKKLATKENKKAKRILAENKEAIQGLKKQLDEGVEVKEESKEEKE